MKSRACYIDTGNERVGAQLLGDFFRKLARLLAGILGEHHGRIGRHITVRGIARRLGGDARLIDPGRQLARGNKRVVSAMHAGKDFGENILYSHENDRPKRRCGVPRR